MKKVKYLAMLLAAGMFAACSDNLEDTGAGNAGGTTPATGEGYVKMSVNLPTASGSISRAEDGSIFDDGLTNEYAVKNGIVVFFSAAGTKSESDYTDPADPDGSATFVKAYPMNNLVQSDDLDDDQVTTTVAYTTEAPLINTSTHTLYALVILNYNTKVIKSENGSLSVGGTSLTVDTEEKKGSTLSDLRKKLENSNIEDYTRTNGFTMTNAPLADKIGTDATSIKEVKAHTLVKVIPYETKKDAEAHSASRIYVERVVGKVTLKGFNGGTQSVQVDGKSKNLRYKDVVNAESVYNGDRVFFQGWTLNVTNKSTKLVRDVTDLTSWVTASDDKDKVQRFIGTSPIDMDYNAASGTKYYRIYWAKDNNYTGEYTPADEFTIYQGTDLPTTWTEDTDDAFDDSKGTGSNPLYCFENTMDQTDMGKVNEEAANGSERITSVLIKTLYYAQVDPETAPTAGDFFICGTDPKVYRLTDVTTGETPNQQIYQGILSYIKATAKLDFDLTLKATTGGIFDNPTEMGDLFYKSANTELTDDEEMKIWNAIGEIKYYKNGESYYSAALIQHFGEADTPWKIEDVESSNKYSHKHLGRFGVVRNNWYEIDINSISGPGDPEPVLPEPDPEYSYVNCEINVLSWAKRSQNVDL